MKPKPIRIRIKQANGRKRELVIEDLVYLSIMDLTREISQEPVFMIDLDTSWKHKNDVKIEPGVKR